MRQIILDTETTGLSPEEGHRIIEIGCIELLDRRVTRNRFHVYLNPERSIDVGASEVHGIRDEDLADKPRFAEVAEDFLNFVGGAELVIHNAPFDVGFLNHELKRLGESYGDLGGYCTVTDTLALARKKHPGQRNSLDALCKRYGVDNSRRELHGALLDAEILADVYLAMTGGQMTLLGEEEEGGGARSVSTHPIAQGPRASGARPALRVVRASEAETARHQGFLEIIRKASGGKCLWPEPDHSGS
ncbi:MAG TPA: DNA polymerase III subunit epsilon [Methylococcaceae bacterium]|nr:DNA polymerase III subunit epsilon [Methylococcaceae bacterium]